jgi:Patatin-like phospholipase
MAATVDREQGRLSLQSIRASEVEAINQRRRALGRRALADNPGRAIEAVGLALSGGGIRSAAFSLGVLQAFNERGVIDRLDYLSTVSGGGYMGASLTATMTATGGQFVFGQGQTAGTPTADISDTDAVGHIRNYANYLIPRGLRDVLTAAAIIVRGLVANVALVLPLVLLGAAASILINPTRSSLRGAEAFGVSLQGWLPVDNFGFTLLLILLGFPLFFAWAIYRSLLSPRRQSEFRGWLPALGASYLVAIAFVFFCELQPFVIAGMFDLADKANRSSEGPSALTGLIKWLAGLATTVAALVAFFRQHLATLLKSVDVTSGLTSKAAALLTKAALWIAGAAVPLLIWVGYLYLCYWGIINDKAAGYAAAVEQVTAAQTVSTPTGTGGWTCAPPPKRDEAPSQKDATQAPQGPGGHTPHWLLRLSQGVSALLCNPARPPTNTFLQGLFDRPITLLYLLSGTVLGLLSWLLKPNANSLHRLYRDRLSKAFLFDPHHRSTFRPARNEASIDQGRDFKPLDRLRLGEISVAHAPYHLINAALNVQGSDFANRRGRNADFFLFSPTYVGSEATGYGRTTELEAQTPLDLATAMAVSGAAFSSNMGAASVRALTATLALLNIRLGYWLKNPGYLDPDPGKAPKRPWRPYLWSEITGRLYENSDEVYITDGGHIENLGVYELLRRRSRVIVVVDGEADPALRFPSFITLQRYARIDLGVRIEMPWDDIRTTNLAWMGHGSAVALAAAPRRSTGPHAAIGTIDYGGGEFGWLLYIKSSLSGDENDYIRDYARRHSLFPHESTSDQFFSEEQFEVYRALGFHIAYGLLRGRDVLEVYGAASPLNINDPDPNVTAIRDALL